MCAAVVVRGECSMLVGMTRWVGRGVVQRKRGGGELLLLGCSGGADLRCGRADAVCGKLGAACSASGMVEMYEAGRGVFVRVGVDMWD